MEEKVISEQESKHLDDRSYRRIDKMFVHKHFERNVLLSRVEQIQGLTDEFEADMVVDATHPFFFEHPLDHIPGMMMVEAGRQLGIAVSHLFLGVPFGTMFFTTEFNIRFTCFAETRLPVLIRARVSDKMYRAGKLIQLHMDGEFYQEGKKVGWMGGEWGMLPNEVYQRFRQGHSTSLTK